MVLDSSIQIWYHSLVIVTLLQALCIHSLVIHCTVVFTDVRLAAQKSNVLCNIVHFLLGCFLFV